MQKTKSSIHTQASTVRQITVSSAFKFDKVEKLTQLVKNITSTKRQTPTSDSSDKVGTQAGVLGEKVLETLKQRVRNNYDQLYSNYKENKDRILKQIQTVETNIAGENHIISKHAEIIKEKAKYDKLKAKIDQIQRKLSKLNVIRAQLKEADGKAQKNAQLGDQQQRVAELAQKKQQMDHKNLILQQMLKQRKALQLSLKERYIKLSAGLQKKKEKMQKLVLQNHRRQTQITKIVQQIQREEQMQIPAKLAQELSSKIDQFENKHSYHQILQHQAVLEQQRFQCVKLETMRRRQEQRQAKLKKQSQEKNKLGQMQALYMIGNLQQEKLKKLCAMESIKEVLNCDLQLDQHNLQRICQQIEGDIEKLAKDNKAVQLQIQRMIDAQQGDALHESLEEIVGKLQEENKRKKLLQSQYAKKSNLANQWLTIMHLINHNRLGKQAQLELIKQIMTLQGKPLREKYQRRENSNLTAELQISDFR